jgi:hypothetical protein
VENEHNHVSWQKLSDEMGKIKKIETLKRTTRRNFRNVSGEMRGWVSLLLGIACI